MRNLGAQFLFKQGVFHKNSFAPFHIEGRIIFGGSAPFFAPLGSRGFPKILGSPKKGSPLRGDITRSTAKILERGRPMLGVVEEENLFTV